LTASGTVTAEQIALASLAAAIGVPLLTLVIQSRQAGRNSFESEALARIQILRDRLEDCQAQLAHPIAGGEGAPFTIIPMTPKPPKEDE